MVFCFAMEYESDTDNRELLFEYSNVLFDFDI